MRELHGVIYAGRVSSQESLKHYVMLFDKLILVAPPSCKVAGGRRELTCDLAFLQDCGIVSNLETRSPEDMRAKFRDLSPKSLRELVVQDFLVAAGSRHLSDQDRDVVGIYGFSPPLPFLRQQNNTKPSLETVLQVGLDSLPRPDQTAALQDLLDFKTELRDKQWGFRRFLKALATKQLTSSEIQDELEWTINEYTNAMKIHHLKASQGFFEVYILPVIEIAEDLAKFNWSKIAKGALDVKKRKVELLEAEMKAPGRECAYVFDARKRFGPR